MLYLAAGDNGDAIYGQLLVVVILAAAVGVYSVFKTRAKRYPGHRQFWLTGAGPQRYYSAFKAFADVAKTAAGRLLGSVSRHHVPATSETPTPVAVVPPITLPKRRNLTGGMELLARDFIVEVVEQIGEVSPLDITMRSLCFDELVRRGELWSVASNALRVYVLDDNGLFSKSIQCEAMKELAGRTGTTPEPKDTETTVYAAKELDG